MKFSHFLLLGALGICAAVLLVLQDVGLSGDKLPLMGKLNQEERSSANPNAKARAEQAPAPDTTVAVASTTTDPSSNPSRRDFTPGIAADAAQTTASFGADEAASMLSASSSPLVTSESPQQRPPAPADDQTHDEQGPDLAISGRVLDDAGEPIPGIELKLTPVRLFDDIEQATFFLGVHEQSTISDYFGQFTFGMLADGEYRILGLGTGYYAPAQVTVRAGTSSAELVLSDAREIRVHGVVVNSQGDPVAGAQVTPILPRAHSVATDERGRYQFHAELASTRDIYSIRFQHAGYREKFVRVQDSDWIGRDTIWVDVSLEAVESTAVVEGSVRSSTGSPLVGEVVQLRSTRLGRHYHAATNQTGNFLIPNVETAQDYQLSINPSRGYQDYEQSNLRVTAEGLRINIELEPQSVAKIAGQMVDFDGNPIPRFSLHLHSDMATNQWLRVTGDELGYFFVDNVPAGALSFRTFSSPFLTVSGIDLPAGGERQISLVLDWGAYGIYGRVVDSIGQPVPLAKVTVTWVYQNDGARSRSSRNTIADAQGHFTIAQLGPGQHTLHITAPGFDNARLDHNVTLQGGEIMVQLKEKI